MSAEGKKLSETASEDTHGETAKLIEKGSDCEMKMGSG